MLVITLLSKNHYLSSAENEFIFKANFAVWLLECNSNLFRIVSNAKTLFIEFFNFILYYSVDSVCYCKIRYVRRVL